MPFSETFTTLGLEICTEGFQNGQVLIGHTDKRKAELNEQLQGVLQSGSLSTKDAERLRGRMIFFEGYTFGRVANSAVKTLSRFCTGPNIPKQLDDEMSRALKFLQERVANGKPLEIEPGLNETWMVFTDGACDQEKQTGSVGGILYNPLGKCWKFFGESVPCEIMTDLFGRSQNPIHELEVLPVLLAADLWGHHYARAQVVYFIDNESSRMTHIRGTGETIRASCLIRTFVNIEHDRQHRVWFGRVPSHSNPSDAPSRLDFQSVLALGAERTSICWERVAAHLELGCGAKLGRC